jgi:hypothetical protein
MKKLSINLVVSIIALLNSSLLMAQLVSTPLEAGMYTFLKEMASPLTFSVQLVDDNHLAMVHPNGVVGTSIAYLAPDNVVISGTVADLVIQNEGVLRDLQSKIDDYNFSGPIGTLKLDPKSGRLTMEHRLNPRYAGPADMAKVAVKFFETLGRLQQRFGGKLA